MKDYSDKFSVEIAMAWYSTCKWFFLFVQIVWFVIGLLPSVVVSMFEPKDANWSDNVILWPWLVSHHFKCKRLMAQYRLSKMEAELYVLFDMLGKTDKFEEEILNNGKFK